MKINGKIYTHEEIEAALKNQEEVNEDPKKAYPLYGQEDTHHLELIDPAQKNQHLMFYHHHTGSCLNNCHKYYGFPTLFAGFLLHMVLGTFYCWGGISKYVASYLYLYDNSITLADCAGIFPFMGLAINCVLFFGVKFGSLVGKRKFSVILIFCANIAVLWCSWIKNYGLFIFVYAVLNGVLGGLVYMNPLILAWSYYPKKRGEISGLIVAGYAFGSFVFNFVALAVVNPDGEKQSEVANDNGDYLYDEEVAMRVPIMFRTLALSYMCLLGAATLLYLINGCSCKIKAIENFFFAHKRKQDEAITGERPPIPGLPQSEQLDLPPESHEKLHELKQVPLTQSMQAVYAMGPLVHKTMSLTEIKDIYRIKKVEEEREKQREKKKEGKTVDLEHLPFKHEDCPSVLRALISWRFYMLVLMAFCSVFFGLVVANSYKNYGLEKIGDDNFLTLVGSISALGNASSRVILATLMDHFGFRKVFCTSMVVQASIALTLQWISEFKVAYIIWIFIALFCFGGNLSMFPVLTTKIFGIK
jgi:MFS family permease